MPTVSCSNCGKSYRVPDDAGGKKVPCKQCGNIIRIPLTTPTAVAAPPVAGTAVIRPLAAAAAKKTPARTLAPPPMPVYQEQPAADAGGDADFNDLASLESTGEVDNTVPFIQATQTAPATRATRTAFKPMVAKRAAPRFAFHLDRWGIAMIIAGIVLTAYGAREWILASSASDQPQDITCADLAANGPGANAHVRITNFISMNNYVAQKNKQTGDFIAVWLPIVPPDVVPKHPKKILKDGDGKVVPKDVVDSSKIHVLIKCRQFRTKDEILPAMKRDSIEGLVINKIESLPVGERNLLQGEYPMMNIDKCYIVEDARQPQGGLGMASLVGGLAMMGLGVLMLFKPN